LNVENLITDHIETWTTAKVQKASGGRGRGKKSNGQNQYGIKKLRELILELAIRGKLVPQNPNDEPASVLLEKIADEKARLIKEGKIKKQKPLPDMGKDNGPVGLSDGWTYAQFGNVVFNRDAERVPLSVDTRKGIQGEYDYYGASGVIDSINDYLFEKPLLLIGEDGANLINRSTPIAFIARGKYWVNNHAHVLDGLSEGLLLYVSLHINAISLVPYVTGTAQPKMNQAKMNSIILAIPPLAEQHRIVAKVDELMALCDLLEQEQTDNSETHQLLVKTLLDTLTNAQNHVDFISTWKLIEQNFDLLFTTPENIDELKQTILQLAVMGKLVPQDLNDEPASVLLKKIAKEKARLVKEGKIKKQKPLPEISEDEKPFELPNNWGWIRLGDYSYVFSGNSFKSGDFRESGGIRVIKITNAGVGTFIESNDFLPDDFLLKYGSFIVKKNDLILALTRPYISSGLKVSKCPESYDESLLNQRVAAIRMIIEGDYVFKYLQTEIVLNIYKKRFGGNGLQPNLKVSDVTNLLIPIPPKTEQNQIVAKVKELMAFCDSLKEQLSDARTTQVQLADAIVGQAV